MSKIRHRLLAVAVAVAWVGLPGAIASADPIFTDQFIGTAGDVLTVYDSDWVNTNNAGGLAGRKAEIAFPGLEIADRPSAGNCLYIGVPDSGSPSLIYEFTRYNEMVDKYLADNATVYASAYFKLDAFGTDTRAAIFVELPFYKDTIGTVREAEFGLYRQTPGEGGGLKVAATYEDNWGGRTELADYVPGSTVQVVLKAVLDPFQTGKIVRFYAAANPSPGAEPAWVSVDNTEAYTGGWHLDEVRVAAYAPNNASFGWIDEIRVGTTYADVVPEPATLALLALGGMLLLPRRR